MSPQHGACGRNSVQTALHIPEFTILVVNCRSIKNKVDEFATLTSTAKPHIIIGTESWLHSSVRDADGFPHGFVVYRSDRNTQGGGVFLLVDASLQSTSLTVSLSCAESVWCNVHLNSGRVITIGSYYRSPACADPEAFRSLSDFLSTLNHDYILGGDFNMPEVQWLDKNAFPPARVRCLPVSTS